MRAAPSVEIQTALRGGWWLTACALWALAAAVLVGTLVWHARLDGLPTWGGTDLSLWLLVGLGGLGLLSAAGAALWHARQHPAHLRWDGSAWHCSLPGQWDEVDQEGLPGHVDTVIDVGDAMLLRWQAAPVAGQPSRQVWLPVARSSMGGAWHGLRVALQQAPTTERVAG